ncbi:MAG: hypothetical protein NC099_00775 [Corallococcus sp.]|nr:hypothetical protein [Corallococcus sp.]
MEERSKLSDALKEFEQSGVNYLPSLYGASVARGTSLDIQFKSDSIYFKRKNTQMSVKRDNLCKSFELLLKSKQLHMGERQFTNIISEGCVQAFFFQLLKYLGLAKIQGTGVHGDKFVAVPLNT